LAPSHNLVGLYLRN